jgi:hypothetical protein
MLLTFHTDRTCYPAGLRSYQMNASLAPVSTTPMENVIGADPNSTSREGRVREIPALVGVVSWG